MGNRGSTQQPKEVEEPPAAELIPEPTAAVETRQEPLPSMQQPEAPKPLVLQPERVTATVPALVADATARQALFAATCEAVTQSAQNLDLLGDEQHIAQARQLLAAAAANEAALHAHAQGLQHLSSGGYVAAENGFDFAGALDAHAKSALQGDGGQRAATWLQRFDQTLGRAGDANLVQSDDEGIQFMDAGGGGGADGGANLMNERCPLTRRHWSELAEPVEDTKGYLYEKGAILNYIAHQGDRAIGAVRCPVAGTTHTVQRDALKLSSRVLHLQRKRRLAGAGPAGGFGGAAAAAAGGHRQGQGGAAMLDADDEEW